MDKLLATHFLIIVYILSVGKLIEAVKCRQKDYCDCYFEDTRNRLGLSCSDYFEIYLHRDFHMVEIWCNKTKWPEFLYDLNFDIGEQYRLSFQNCEAPPLLQTSDQSSRNNSNIYRSVLGISGLGDITFQYVHGQLRNDELKLYPNLTGISIIGSDLKNLKREFFSYSPKLEDLQLVQDKFSVVDDLFYDLTFLEKLFLSDNEFLDIKVDVFKNLQNLNQLDISNNSLRDIEVGMFDALVNLWILNLAENNLREIKDGTFRALTSLKELDLSGNNLRKLKSQVFQNSTHLKRLNLSGNYLTEIEIGSFDALEHLEELDFSGNNLTKLESQIFQNLTYLWKLMLNANNFPTLSNDLFKSLINLQFLDLSENNFFSLPADLFIYIPHLPKLWLGLNKQNLVTLPPTLFSNSAYLTELKLIKNGLLELPKNIFEGCESLAELDLSGNLLPSLDPEIFQNLPRLELLSLSNNHLKELRYETFQNLRNLKHMNLSNNHLKELTYESFPKFNLDYLDLSYNHLKQLRYETFRNLTNLSFLNLSNNHLNEVQDGSFKGLTSIKELDLSHNHLKYLDQNTLSGLESILELLINNNDLTFLHPETFEDLENLQSAEFTGNKLSFNDTDYQILDVLFNSCHYLKKLSLANNKISKMLALRGLPSLRIVDLKGNFIEIIEPKHFIGRLPDLLKVDLSFNKISRINISSYERFIRKNTWVCIEGNPIQCDCDALDFIRYVNNEGRRYELSFFELQVKDVYCPDNTRITDLRPQSYMCAYESNQVCESRFRPNDGTLIIDCSKKNLTKVPEIKIDKNVTRIELNLHTNDLKECPSMLTSELKKVEVLNVSNNRITSLNIGILSPNLKVIDLSNNSLDRIDKKILDFWINSSDIKVSLGHNRWKCDHYTKDLLSFIHSNASLISEPQNVICYEENQSSTTPRSSHSNNKTSTLLPTSTLLLLLIIIFALLF